MAEHCYCGLWQTSPETLRGQGIPEGYCGLCSVCGQPGHTRAHPYAPTTDARCDTCYAALLKPDIRHYWPQLLIVALCLLPLIALLVRCAG